MRPALAIAAFVALHGAEASAQNEAAPTLTADNIVRPDSPSPDGHLDIGLVASKPLAIPRAEHKVSGLVNGVKWSFADDSVSVEPDCNGAKKFPITVAPDKPCRVGVTLKAMERPGHYTATLSLFGAGGERQNVALDFAVRRSVWCAVILVIAGLIMGVIVTSWRGGGRDRTRRIIAIKEAIEILTDLDRSVPPAPRMGPVIVRAREMEAALLRAVPVDDAEFAELQSRVSQYRFLRDIEARAAGLPGDKRPLNAAIDDAVDAMSPLPSGKLAPVPDATFQAVRDRFEELETAAASARVAGGAEDLPIDPLPLPVTQTMSSATARLAFRVAEWVVALVLFVVFVAVALGTLYFNNAYWGGYGDMLAAFMIGFGAYAGAVASVDSFVQRARTVPT